MNTKAVYQIDSSGHFLSEAMADESPMEPGVFLIPAGCVELAPPESWPENQWPRWNGFKWDLIQKPHIQTAVPPEQKLAEFLAENPDVMALIKAK